MSLNKWMFQAGLSLNAWLTRRPRLRWLESKLLTPAFVRWTQHMRGVPTIAPTAEALGAEWSRLLGRRAALVVARDEQTVYGEIHVHCPLRGTGDVHACHRLMAFDRGLLKRHGGRLVVLASQAEPGRSFCRVAIRPLAVDSSDLVAAHERVTHADPRPPNEADSSPCSR